MITFHLREFTQPFFQHTLFIPEQDISYDEVCNKDYRYLQFEGCDNVVLRLVCISLSCVDKDTYDYYTDVEGRHRVQVQPKHDKITVEIVDKENGVVYDTFIHRQDILEECVRLCDTALK